MSVEMSVDTTGAIEIYTEEINSFLIHNAEPDGEALSRRLSPRLSLKAEPDWPIHAD